MDSKQDVSVTRSDQTMKNGCISSNEKPVSLFGSTTQEQTIARYFEKLNTKDFQATAQLFSKHGVLRPPFEAEIVGSEAIAQYLNQEAHGLQLVPRQVVQQAGSESHNPSTTYEVIGSVKTSLFSVNAKWTFVLSEQAEIDAVDVRLLANFRELLQLEQKRSAAQKP